MTRSLPWANIIADGPKYRLFSLLISLVELLAALSSVARSLEAIKAVGEESNHLLRVAADAWHTLNCTRPLRHSSSACRNALVRR